MILRADVCSGPSSLVLYAYLMVLLWLDMDVCN